MKVTNDYNTHKHHQQRPNGKDNGFADMFAHMNSKKHGKPEPSKGCCHCHCTRPTETKYAPLRLVNPHKYLGREIKLPAEQSAVLEKVKRGEPSGSECLEKYEEADKPEFHYSQPFTPPPPKYPVSIYDIPADELKTVLLSAKKACENLDTTGMSKAEIYNSIETIYTNYLGKDFKLQALIGGVISEHNTDLVNAHHEFNNCLKEHGINPRDSDFVREARGYDGMSDSEIKAAVRGKYPQVMTLKDCILMSHELRNLGFEKEGAVGSRMKDCIITTIGPIWSPALEKVFESMLDMPADFDAFMSKYEAFAKNDYKFTPPQNINEMLEQLMSWMGGGGLYNQEMLNQIREMLEAINLDLDLKDVAIS